MKKNNFLLACAFILSLGFCTISCDDNNDNHIYQQPTISIEDPSGKGEVMVGKSITLKAAVTHADEAAIVWTVNGKEAGRGAELTLKGEQTGDQYLVKATVTNEEGEQRADLSIVVYGKYKYGTFVLNEGNMTSEDGFVTFINPEGEVTNKAFFEENGKYLGNALQDMCIANGKIYFVSQNGNRNGGEGHFVIANAETLKKEAAYTGDDFAFNWPAHIAAIGSNVFIQQNDGIVWFNETTGTFKMVENTGSVQKKPMLAFNNKIFASAGNNLLVLENKNGNFETKTVNCGNKIEGITKADDNHLWIACGGTPSSIVKINAENYSLEDKHDITEISLSSGWENSFTTSSKGDSIYMRKGMTIYRHIFSQNTTEKLVVLNEKLENASMMYNNINVHPTTGEVYANTIKGYGNDYLINDISVWNFNGNEPVMTTNLQNYTHFPTGIYFTESFR